MTRQRGELPEEEEAFLGIERPSLEQETDERRAHDEKIELRRKFLVGLMQSDLFREWLMDQIIAFGAFDNIFAAGPTGVPDNNATWFMAGKKAAGWTLWTAFDEVAPELASLMRRERQGN